METSGDILMTDVTALGCLYPMVGSFLDAKQSHSINGIQMGYYSSLAPDTKTSKSRHITEADWPQVKKLLSTMYIAQNQSLRRCQRHLRESCNLIVTEKQLTRKLSELGMRKNVKTRDQETLMQEFEASQSFDSMHGACGKVTPAKVLRWKKEKNKLRGMAQSICSHENKAPSSHTGNTAYHADYLAQESSILSTKNEINIVALSDQIQDTDTLLTQLFKQLELDVPTDIKQFQENIPAENDVESIGCNFVSFANTRTLVPAGKNLSSHWEAGTLEMGSKVELVTVVRGSDKAFIYKNVDVIFPTGNWIFPSPYNEIYPFPLRESSTNRSVRWSNSSPSLSPDRKKTLNEIEERASRLKKIQRVLPTNALVVIAEMHDIAAAFFELGAYSEAEPWFRKILQASDIQSEKVQWYVVRSWLMLSTVLVKRERWLEAKRIHEIARGYLQDLSTPCEALWELWLETGDNIAYNFDDYANQEHFNHQLTQIRLTRYGPRSQKVIESLTDLALAKYGLNKFKKCAELTNILCELSTAPMTNFSCPTPTRINILHLLAEAKHKLGAHKEAEVMWNVGIQEARDRLGSNDLVTLDGELRLARAMLYQHADADGEKILLKSIPKLLDGTVTGDLSNRNRIACFGIDVLAELYQRSGRYKEAAMWWSAGVDISTSGGFLPSVEASLLFYGNLIFYFYKEGAFKECTAAIEGMKAEAEKDMAREIPLLSLLNLSDLVSSLDQIQGLFVQNSKERQVAKETWFSKQQDEVILKIFKHWGFDC